MTEWRRESKYHETNGRYNVAAVKCLRYEDTNPIQGKDWRGRPTVNPNMGGRLHWAFEAWKVSGKQAVWIGTFDTAEEARKRCEEHAACDA